MVARAERVALSSGQRRVAVAGNPNSGKTVIFNTLTGLRHKVGNYPGVTVEKREGTLAGTDVTLLDLPGAYGLSARSPDQEIARDALLGRIQGTRRPDGVLLVIDASNLERNLYLASQILDVGMPVVIACNMMDVAAERGLHVDCDALTHELGVPVIPTVATKGVGITDLRRALDNVDHHKPPPRPWRLPPPFEDAIERAADAMARSGATPPYAAHGSALLWLSDYLSGEAASRRSAEKYLADLAPPYAAELCAAAAVVDEHSNDAAAEAIEARYAWISNVAQRVVVAEPESPDHTGHTPTDRIDRVLTHRVFGLVIFIGLMFVLFLSIFSWAEPLMDLIEAGQEALTDWIGPMFDEGPLKSLITDGIIAGVGSVIIFFPQICILFLCLAVLEDSGYMARAAFLMDRLMSRVGLHGRSFIPLLSCYACAIPGIMATRTIENKRDRFTTILVAPLMSCSARMPVYLIIIAAVFADNTWLKAGTMFGLYVLGTAAALLMALIFKKTLLAGPRPTFIMELPPYHVPRLLPILRVMWDRSRVFLTHAGTIIFAACILIWALSYFPYIDESELPPDVQARLAALDDHQEQTRSSPWQNCGTGVSPVVFTVRNGVSEPLFSL
ncbi:MAG: ferrous iron transport protein B, partial [Phycisphaerae bacterium]|nr:ferrous iron transport protein B [Phycisphaerae bacterium]